MGHGMTSTGDALLRRWERRIPTRCDDEHVCRHRDDAGTASDQH
jgi:hypothetical protein